MVALVLVFLGCGAADSGPVELRFWAMGREGEVLPGLLEEFHREQPDIRVKVQQLPWLSAHEKLLTAFAGDATPDLCQLGNTWIPEFAALGALAELETYAEGSGGVPREDFFPGVWDTNVVEDRLLGVPWYVDTRLFFYRKDLLLEAGVDAPPTTWDEWRVAMARIKALVGPKRYAVLLPLNEFEPLVILSLQRSHEMLRDGGRHGNFRDPDIRAAFAFYAEIFANDWAPLSTNTEISNVWQELGNGFFTFYISGPWNIGEFKRRLPPEKQGSWMTAPLPGPEGPGASMAGGSSVVIFRRSRHPEAAWKVIEYLSRPAVQIRFHEATGNLPPRKSSWEHPILAEHVYAHAFREQLERVRALPKVPEWERIATQMRLSGERVVEGGMSVEQAVAELDRAVDAILEKRRSLLAPRGGG